MCCKQAVCSLGFWVTSFTFGCKLVVLAACKYVLLCVYIDSSILTMSLLSVWIRLIRRICWIVTNLNRIEYKYLQYCAVNKWWVWMVFHCATHTNPTSGSSASYACDTFCDIYFYRTWLWLLVIWVPGTFLPSPTSLPSLTSDPGHHRGISLLNWRSLSVFSFWGPFSVVCQSLSGSSRLWSAPPSPSGTGNHVDDVQST